MGNVSLFVTVGVPGSGKSHVSALLAKEFGFFHLQADFLRAAIFQQPQFTPQEHDTVYRVMDFLAARLLSQGFSVIYDANLNKRHHRLQKKRLADEHGARFGVLLMEIDEAVALGRIAERESQGYPIKVTRDVFDQLQRDVELPLADENVIVLDGLAPADQHIQRFAETLKQQTR